MGDASFALCYCIFALLFVYLNLVTLNIADRAQIYNSVLFRYNNQPYSGVDKPPKDLESIGSTGELYEWLNHVFQSVTYTEQVLVSANSSCANATGCLNGTIALNWGDLPTFSGTYSPATVGSFNRVLLFRLTAKRWELTSNDHGKFKETYPQVLAGGDTELSFKSRNSHEEQGEIVRANGTRRYRWQEEDSLYGAGGYSIFVDPMGGKQAFQDQLTTLLEDGWFDRQLGTFAVDMIVYNSNVDQFMQIVWIFSFDFAGNCRKTIAARGFNLNITDRDRYALEFALRWLLLIMLLVFYAREVLKIWEVTLVQHLKKAGAWIDVTSLVLCTIVLVSYWVIEDNDLYSNFEFAQLENANTRAQTYSNLEDLAMALEEQSYLIAFNLLIVFVRAVCLIAGLQSNLGLIFRVLDVSASNLAYFFGMFIMIMTGFVLFSFFVFGAGFQRMSTMRLAFYQTFAMLRGVQIYDDIEAVDATMAPIFFYLFYLLFYLIMLNVYVSILLSGYDEVEDKIKQKHLRGEKERNPLAQMAMELKHDFFDRGLAYFRSGMSCARWVLKCLWPIQEALKELLMVCYCPSIIPKRFRSGTKADIADSLAAPQQASLGMGAGHNEEEEDSKRREKWLSNECACMFFFMINFITLMQIQTRGADSYYVSQATLHLPMKQSMWEAIHPSRVEDFDDIVSFEDVSHWVSVSIQDLYLREKCVVVQDDGSTLQVPLHGVCNNNLETCRTCDNVNASEQLIQVVSDWNIGFLNTTFVRLTIQPACFVRNPEPKWAAGSPIIRKTPERECATGDCISVLEEEACHTFEGYSLDMSSIENFAMSGSSLSYNFSKPGEQLGSNGLLGGFVFSLGNSWDACHTMLKQLKEDRWFTKNSASMVFDWITYNGNLDMFTYNMAAFSLLATGEMSKTVRSQTFPLNLDKGGGYFAVDRIVILILFGLYAFLVLYYIFEFMHTLLHPMISKRSDPKAVKEHVYRFVTNPWNLSDFLSLVLSIVSIIYFMMFALMPFRRNYKFSIHDNSKFDIPNDAVKSFGMPKATDATRFLSEDWYIFWQFERADSMYSTFLTIAALNSFFISIKVVKYVGHIKAVSVFSDTLDSGKEVNAYFALIITMMLFGFALFFYIIYGQAVPSMNSLSQTLATLFYWMIGWFDIDPLLQVDENIAILVFVVFQVVFYFICVNMFLATMLNKYSETVGEKDVREVRNQVNKTRYVRMVEYPDKETLRADIIAIERREEDDEFVVREIRMGKEGLAAKLGVSRGHIIYKVNGDKVQDKWKGKNTEDFMETGIEPDKRDDLIRVVFKEAHKKTEPTTGMRLRVGLKEVHEDKAERVKPTVKNFWRNQGAITWVWRDVSSLERIEEKAEKEAIDAEIGDEDDEEAEEVVVDKTVPQKELQSREASKRAARVRTKKRLDALLFSRWSDGTRGGLDGASSMAVWEAAANGGQGNAASESAPTRQSGGGSGGAGSSSEAWDEVGIQEDWDIADLRDVIERLPVSGQEAWLDCLVAAIEREMENESIVTDVLRTSEMQDMRAKNQASKETKPLQEFYEHVDSVLKILEFKARKKYYQYLQQESEERQEHLRKQNNFIHDYICELEKEFENIMESIHSYRAKKEVMLTKLAGLLDKDEYGHLDHQGAGAASGSAGGGYRWPFGRS